MIGINLIGLGGFDNLGKRRQVGPQFGRLLDHDRAGSRERCLHQEIEALRGG